MKILFALTLLISTCLLAQDSLTNEALTGSYQSVLDSNITFNIKVDIKTLILDVPGQGQTPLQPNGGRRYKPVHVPATLVEFIPDGKGQVQKFHWLQNMNAEMVKLPGDNSANAYTGKYKLKNNPYIWLT